MATLRVSGVAALLKSAHPEWTADQVRAALLAGATPSVEHAIAVGAGIVNACRALRPAAECSPVPHGGGIPGGVSGVQEEPHVGNVDEVLMRTCRNGLFSHLGGSVAWVQPVHPLALRPLRLERPPSS